MKKILQSLFYSTLILSSHFATASSLGDKTVGQQIGSIGGEVGIFGNFMLLIIAVVGVVVLLSGAMGLKKYADDSRSNPLMKPLIYFIVGGILTGFSAFQGMLGKSATGEIDDTTSRGAFKADDLK